MVGHEKAVEMVMSAGGDFELVFTVRPDGLKEAMEAGEVTVIGRVVEEGIWMEAEGKRKKIDAKGYEHKIGGCD
jgi:thiamine-monophosphate kinase